MCMTKVVVLRTMLGEREIGWELWNRDKGEVVEMTSNEIKKALSKGDPIYGLTVGENGELVLDNKNFFMTNLFEHRHVNNYKPMVDDTVANVAYIILGKVGNEYEVISTKWQKTTVTEDTLRVYISMGLVFGGAKLEGNKVVLPDLEKKAVKPDTKKEETKKEEKKQ